MTSGRAARSAVIVITGIGALVGGVACSNPRSVDDLSRSLITVDDLPGEWTVNRGDPENSIADSGIVTDEQRDLLPTVELCDAAGEQARSAAAQLRWDVFRQLDKTVDDPIDLPADREGRIVFVQEFMMSDEPEDLIALLDDLVPGVEACLGDIPAGEEGPGTATKIDLTSAGDEHVAVLTQIEEKGGRGMWYVYNAIVREGSVLMSITLADVFLGELRPEIDLADFDAIVATAVDKL